MKTSIPVVLILFFLANGLLAQENSFKILKIKSKKDFYIIQAKRNDSLFKIISLKTSTNQPNSEQIKKGNDYIFTFDRPDTLPSSPVPLKSVMNHLDSRTIYVKPTQRFHNKIYTTNELFGLYYSK
jgi:hypothetical protein